MLRRILIFFLLMPLFSISPAQDISFARTVIRDLTSPSMHGRGYVKNGDRKAAVYIHNKFDEFGLKHFGKDYFQHFSFPVNTLPGKITLKVDDKKLVPGEEYLIASSSPTLKGTYELVWLQNAEDSVRARELLSSSGLANRFVVSEMKRKDLDKSNPFGSTGVINLVDSSENLWWHVSNGRYVKDYVIITMREQFINKESANISISVKNKYLNDHKARNVIAYVEGTREPDSFMVITAHYDHLGRMGKDTYFPGANDNASGTAMMLDLARHYSMKDNAPGISVAFIALSGEEVGLYGSGYYTDNPLFPLEDIRFLVNLDMVGTGSAGITVVNGRIYKEAFQKLAEINEEQLLLNEVKARGEACNSDHCPFYRKGVPSFFIYTRGDEYQEYHNVKDREAGLPLTEYEDLFRLMIEFIDNIDE